MIAEAIRDLAADNDVPILRFPRLTRAIYDNAAVGQPIRDELFGEAAAVVAFFLALDDRVRYPLEVDIPDAKRFYESGAQP